MLVQNVLSKQSGWIKELNFSLKLLCFMLSQVLKMLILKYYFHTKDKKCPTTTLSGQDEVNLAFSLATQAGNVSPFCPLWISRVGPASKSSLLGHVIIHLLTTLVRSRWLNIGLINFCIFIDQDQAVLCGPWRLHL